MPSTTNKNMMIFCLLTFMQSHYESISFEVDIMYDSVQGSLSDH